MTAYFDNSATTKPLPEAVDAVARAMTETWGNPSSLHAVGDAANEQLEAARRTLASAFGCKPQEVYFTAGGTESNNIAVFGTVEALKRRGNRIVTTAVEHPSVEECMKRLEADGFDVVRLPVDTAGRISEEAIFEAVNEKTILVSLMLVNNEVGSIMPVKAAAKALKRAGAPGYLHVDAVQGFGKLPVGPKALGADLISVSSHKVQRSAPGPRAHPPSRVSRRPSTPASCTATSRRTSPTSPKSGTSSGTRHSPRTSAPSTQAMTLSPTS